MKPISILLVLVLGVWLVLASLLFVPRFEKPRGFDHPQHKAMSQGRSGAERHDRLVWHWWALGSLALLMFATLLGLGVRDDRLRTVRWYLLLGVVIELGLFLGVVLSYRRFVSGEDVRFLGPFPIPTALMVFGMWGMGSYYVMLYVVMFRKWFWTDEDAARYRDLLERSRSEEVRS